MKVIITKETVVITEYSCINEGEVCVNTCYFDLPECFQGLCVTAAFNNIPVPVTDNKCNIPSLKKGTVTLGVYAYREDENGVTLMYSPKPTVFYVNQGSYSEEIGVEEMPSVTEFEKYCTQFSEMAMGILEDAEMPSNKVTEITEESTDEQYPSAKATYTGILKEKSRANNNFANAVKGVANGSVVRIDDVSPIEHTVKINVQGDIENTIVNRCGKNLFHINEYNLKTDEPWGAMQIGNVDIKTGKYVASCMFKQVGTDKSQVALSIRNKDDLLQVIKTVRSTDTEGSLICPFDVGEDVNGVAVLLYSNITEGNLSTECDFTHIQLEAGESATDFEVYKGKETYTPDENGDVTVKSVSPTMTLTTNNGNVTLSCEYNKDLNKCISQNAQVVDILTEVSTDEEHTNEQVYGALAMDETLTSFAEALEEKQDKIKSKVFEEIATVTVTADENGDLPTRIVINKDDNGNAFELTDIYCDVIIGMTDGASGRFYITASGTTLFGNTNIDLRSDTLRKWCFRYDSFGENNGGLCTAPNGTLALTAGYPSSNNGNLYGQPVPIGKTVIVRDLQFIGQVGTTKTFMDGTTITLWGVRK